MAGIPVHAQTIIPLAENKRFFLQQKQFEEGENRGHMLALLAKSQQASSHIVAVANPQGTICYSTQDIIDTFKDFFQEVYTSKVHPSQEDICTFLDKYPLPCISTADAGLLNAPLTEEELLEALAHTQNDKAPGADGLPAEVFKRYATQLILILLQVYNYAFETGRLPPSMSEALIIVLLKPGKDALSPDAYRPISLLTFDIKLLARVLANRLAKCIQTVIYRDQSGFIPTRSTSQNLRRLFLNLQLPTDNMSNRAIFSLDAVKAFDSVEWPYLWETLKNFSEMGSTVIQ